jgi:NAD-dependent SIR2 family protein deacetylase
MSEYARNLDTYMDGGPDDDEWCFECGGELTWVKCSTCKGVDSKDCPDCDDDGDVCLCSECGETVDEVNERWETIHDALVETGWAEEYT